MRYVGRLEKNSLIAAALSLAVLLSFAVSMVVRAESTVINTVVCSSMPAALNITSPASGTTVVQNPVLITGTIARVSQVRVDVDGTYFQTIPTAVGDSTFSFSYTVPEGAHTLKLTGVDVCQNGDAEQNLVLSYATGGTTTPVTPVPNPTANPNPNSNNVPGAGVSPTIPESSPLSQLQGTPFGRVVAGAMYSALVSLDFGSATTLEQVPANLGRFAMTATGLTAMVFPTILYAGYRGLKMTVLSNVLPNIPMLASPQALLATRIFGLVTFLIPIILLT